MSESRDRRALREILEWHEGAEEGPGGFVTLMQVARSALAQPDTSAALADALRKVDALTAEDRKFNPSVHDIREIVRAALAAWEAGK